MTFMHLQCALNLWVEVVYYFRVCDGKSWGRRESIAAAVEEIILCLRLKQKLIQLLWFNRITKEKKIFREGEGMCIIHRNAMAQYLLSLDRKKAQSDRMLWLSPLWFQKKTANLANILFLLFLVDCHSFSFESQPRSIQMETTNKQFFDHVSSLFKHSPW